MFIKGSQVGNTFDKGTPGSYNLMEIGKEKTTRQLIIDQWVA
jgi:hypothetical protein